MGAQMIIPQAQADDGFSLLKDIVAMVKNPDAIDEAYQRRLDAAKLTDDEVAKANEARALIAQAAQLKADLNQQQAIIEADKISLSSDISAFETRKQSEADRLKKWEDELSTAAVAHTESERKNQETAKALEDQKTWLESDYAAKVQSLNDKEMALNGVAEAQKAEDARLATWRDQLKDKAGKLAALAQSDG